jgi:hypothetical protein
MMRLAGWRVPDRKVDELLADPMLAPVLTAVAAAAAERASADAPVLTGNYRRTIRYRPAAAEDGASGPVQRAYTYSVDTFAHLVEFGSANNPAHRTLTAAAMAHSATFTDGKQ